jgi:hypothetical protein
MRNIIAKCLIIYGCVLFSLYHASIAYGEPTLEETRKLLQKGLNIYEIDQEVARLSAKEEQLAIEILKVEQDITANKELVAAAKTQAGDVLRAYYMGEKESLLALILSAKNLSEAMAVFEFVNIIFENDQKTLDQYLDVYRELKDMHAELLSAQIDLQEVKEQFLNQRQVLITLQEELDAELSVHPESERLAFLIQELTLKWENQGLPIFKNYFKALAKAMNQLPEIRAMHKNIVSMKGSTIQFQITDDQLNEFLISKDELFKDFAFEFTADKIEAVGKHNGMEVTIRGHYSLVQEPDNVIRFHVDELIYDGFTLPESTNRSLEEEFDLGFYPAQLEFLGLQLEATDVITESNKLRVLLKFK